MITYNGHEGGEAVLEYIKDLEAQTKAAEQRVVLSKNRGDEALERYAELIAFKALCNRNPPGL